MSFYSFFRTSALLVLAGKYRLKLFYVGAAIAFAFVTAWLYEDIANFLQAHNPQWLFLALVVKTLLVYGALFFVFWQIRPSEWRRYSEPERKLESPAEKSKLDEIAGKEKLSTRKNAILRRDREHKI
jgi:type VI protein secretion system component VasK